MAKDGRAELGRISLGESWSDIYLSNGQLLIARVLERSSVQKHVQSYCYSMFSQQKVNHCDFMQSHASLIGKET